MTGVLLACRLIVSGAFLLAALAKLADREGTRASFRDFGVPAAAIPVAVIAVPLVELFVAAALLPTATATGAAWAAVALLVVFTAAIARVVASGQEAECHCFGRVSSRPVGPGTLARNGVLIALAAAVGIGGAGASATNWVADLSTVEIVLASISLALALGLAFNTAFLFQLFRQNGRLVAELASMGSAPPAEAAGPQVGAFAPAFELPDLTGTTVELDELLTGEHGLILLFTSPDCGACDPLLPAVGRRQREPADGPAVVPITLGDADVAAAKAAEHGIDRALLIEDFELPHALGISGFPGAVVIDRDGRVAEKAVQGTTAVGELIGHQPAPPDLVHVGGPA